jgi:hypothetical protein
MKAVELIKPHTHAGVGHPIGAVITVSVGTAAYLEEHGIGRLVLSRPAPVSRKPLPKKRTRGGSKS